jgi:hypothetical protein
MLNEQGFSPLKWTCSISPEIDFWAVSATYQEECNTSGIANLGFCCLGHIGFHTLPYLPQNLGQILNTNEIYLPSKLPLCLQ